MGLIFNVFTLYVNSKLGLYSISKRVSCIGKNYEKVPKKKHSFKLYYYNVFLKFSWSGKISARTCDERVSVNLMSTSMNFIVETRKLSSLVISFMKNKFWRCTAINISF